MLEVIEINNFNLKYGKTLNRYNKTQIFRCKIYDFLRINT